MKRPPPVPARALAVAVALLAVAAGPAAAQCGYFGDMPCGGIESEPVAVPPTPAATPTPSHPPVLPATPTPPPAGSIALEVRWAAARGRPRPSPATVPAGTAVDLLVRADCTRDTSATLNLAAMALDAELGRTEPAHALVTCGGTWRLRFQAGSGTGRTAVLVAARDPRGRLRPASALVDVAVVPAEPVLAASDSDYLAEPYPDRIRSRTRSWRAAVELRRFIYPGRGWVAEVARSLTESPDMREALTEAVELDRGRLAATGHWPEASRFRSYARLEKLMSQYWAEGGLALAAGTANEIGNVFLTWHRSPGLTVTLSEEVARTVGSRGGHVIKVGRVLNGVGFTMILLDFWNAAASAETPVEAREAWLRAGYSSLDLYLSNVVADTFGAAAALPGMFVSFVLTNAYDTLISGHKECWWRRLVRQAVAEHYLGTGIHDRVAVDRVLRAMRSPRGLRGTLIDWWRAEGPNWAGKLGGGCGSWDLAEARGYTQALVDRLLHSRTVEVDGRTYSPTAFYWAVSRELVRERRNELARQVARGLLRLEAAYLETLHQRRYRARFQLVGAGAERTPIPGARVRPVDRDDGVRTTDEAGWVTLELAGDEFSPSGEVALLVRTEWRRWVFVLPRNAFREVTR